MRHFVILSCLLALTACSSIPDTAPAPTGFYRVRPGDTLYRIALNQQQSLPKLVAWNKQKDPSSISVGQLLRVTPPVTASKVPTPTPSTATVTENKNPVVRAPLAIRLQWPLRGVVITRFNGNSNKGIDIEGKAGDPVHAAAGGTVAYAGKGIRAYGNLLIIKHGNDYLTAYAHNQTLLVKEGQTVQTGQQIATVGRTGSNRDMLHFELRRQGRAIDPLSALPAQ